MKNLNDPSNIDEIITAILNQNEPSIDYVRFAIEVSSDILGNDKYYPIYSKETENGNEWIRVFDRLDLIEGCAIDDISIDTVVIGFIIARENLKSFITYLFEKLKEPIVLR